MLTPSNSQISFGSPRQIAVTVSATNTVMYTVPLGKKFQGTIHTSASGASAGITPLGGSRASFVTPSLATTSTTSSALPLTLVAGSIIATTSTGGAEIYLIGVETDA